MYKGYTGTLLDVTERREAEQARRDEVAAAIAPPHRRTRLREALDGDGLSLHLQPIHDLRSGSLAGFEALLHVPGDGDGENPSTPAAAYADDSA